MGIKFKAVYDKQMEIKGPVEITFYVAIEGINPPIWRTLKLSSQMTLDTLHYAIQGSFGWDNSHLHAFNLSRSERYSDNTSFDMEEFGTEEGKSHKFRLSALILRKIKKMTYDYDFGDSWHHEIKIVAVNPLEKPLKYPECLEGELSGPPEDCGGIWGFENFKEVMSDPKHEEYESMKEWYGERFNPEKFSIRDANRGIREYFT